MLCIFHAVSVPVGTVLVLRVPVLMLRGCGCIARARWRVCACECVRAACVRVRESGAGGAGVGGGRRRPDSSSPRNAVRVSSPSLPFFIRIRKTTNAASSSSANVLQCADKRAGL